MKIDNETREAGAGFLIAIIAFLIFAGMSYSEINKIYSAKQFVLVSPSKGAITNDSSADDMQFYDGAYGTTVTLTQLATQATTASYATTATVALSGWPTATPVPVAANPSASVNGTVTNGSAATFMRSDGAPALADPFTPADATQNITGTLSASVAVFGAQLQGYSALTNLLRPYTAASNLAFRLWNDSYGFDFQKTDGTSKAFLSATGDFQMDGALDVDGTSTSTIAGQVAVAGNVDVTSGVAAGTYFFLPQHAEPPAGQVRGALYFDTDDNKAKCWNGSGWQDLY